jgi:WD40 repeat protein
MFQSCLCLCLLSIPGQTSPKTPDREISFINDVAPIIMENCFACHDPKKRKGKLDMSTYETLRKGGGSDDPITPGKPDESLIMSRVMATDKSRMPPLDAGDALAKEKIAVLEKWIAGGAKLDAGVSPKADLYRELRARWEPPPPPASYPYPVTVTALAFTPDNHSLVVGGQHELTVWDVSSGRLLERVATRAERSYAMEFLPDGKLVVAGGRPGREGDVRVYDLKGGKTRTRDGVVLRDGVHDPAVMVKQLLEADDSVLCLAVSPDGKRLASGGCDRMVTVWNLSGGIACAKLMQSVENHADWVLGLALAADGKHLLTCSRDKTAKVWDLVARESVLTFPDHQNPVYGVALKPDGSVAVSVGEDNQLRFWPTTGEAKQIRASGGHGKAVFHVIYHPKKPLLLTCSADGTVRIWNADNGKNLRSLTGHTDWVYALALSPDGNLAAAGSWNGEVKVWQVADGKLVNAFNASPGLPTVTAVLTPKKPSGPPAKRSK